MSSCNIKKIKKGRDSKMKISRLNSFISVFFLTIFILFIITGYAFCSNCNIDNSKMKTVEKSNPKHHCFFSRYCKGSCRDAIHCVSKETFSLRGTANESGTGMVNIVFCWLEIPCEIKGRLRDNKWNRIWCIIPNSFDILFGTTRGASRGIMRGLGGVCEVILSPFPPYCPLMTPAYPPYFESEKNTEEKKNNSECTKM